MATPPHGDPAFLATTSDNQNLDIATTMNHRSFFDTAPANPSRSRVETDAPFVRAHHAGATDRTRPIDHLAFGKSEADKLAYADALVDNIQRAQIKRSPLTGAVQVQIGFEGQE